MHRHERDKGKKNGVLESRWLWKIKGNIFLTLHTHNQNLEVKVAQPRKVSLKAKGIGDGCGELIMHRASGFNFSLANGRDINHLFT